MNRNSWLQTNDPRYVILVPQFEHEDILVLDREDDDVPDNLEFVLVCTLKDARVREARKAAKVQGLRLKTGNMAVTFRND